MFKSYADDFFKSNLPGWFGDERWTTIDTLSAVVAFPGGLRCTPREIFRGEKLEFLTNPN